MSMLFHAGHLPGLDPDTVAWRELDPAEPGLAGVMVPVLSVEQIQTVIRTVREQSALHLRSMSLSDIIHRIDAAIGRLLDPQDPARQVCDPLLARVCGLDAEMVRLNLNRYLKTFRAQGLHRFVAEDLPNPKVLDEFQPLVKGGWARAWGPDPLLHLWAGNVPALPLWSLVCGLLAKAGNVGKLASAEPVFATVFVQVLVQVEPRWRNALALLWWMGGDLALESAALAQAETVIAYGGDETLQALRQRLPADVRFLPHGHKLSFGLIAASSLTARHAPDLALAAAQDVARHDQGGVILRTFFMCNGVDVCRRLSGLSAWRKRCAISMRVTRVACLMPAKPGPSASGEISKSGDQAGRSSRGLVAKWRTPTPLCPWPPDRVCAVFWSLPLSGWKRCWRKSLRPAVGCKQRGWPAPPKSGPTGPVDWDMPV